MKNIFNDLSARLLGYFELRSSASAISMAESTKSVSGYIRYSVYAKQAQSVRLFKVLFESPNVRLSPRLE